MDADVTGAGPEALAQCARPIRWGIDDCAPWAADRLVEAGCADFFSPWRGRYRDKAGRDAVMREAGGLVRATIRALRGAARVAPQDAVPPAAGLMRCGDEVVCGVCHAPGWFVVRGPGAAAFVPAARVLRAWQLSGGGGDGH